MCKANTELQVCWQKYKLIGANALKYLINSYNGLEILKMYDLQQ